MYIASYEEGSFYRFGFPWRALPPGRRPPPRERGSDGGPRGGDGDGFHEWTEEIPDDEIYLALNDSNWTNGGVYAYFWGGSNPTQWMGVAATPDSETVNANGATNLYVVDGYDRSSTNIILHVNGSQDYRWDWYDKNATLPEGGCDIFVQTAVDSFNGYKADSFIYREILVESPVQPNLHYWTELNDSDDYGTTWPGIQMKKVEDAYEYDVSDGYDLYRGVARYVEGYETQGLIINSDGGQTETFSSWDSAPGYVFRYDGKTGLSWDDSATKRSAYEFLQDWRTLRKEHEGEQDSICWLLDEETKLGEVLESYEGASSYLSGVTDIEGVTIGETIEYLRSVSGGTAPGGEAFRPFSGEKEEGTLYLLGGALLIGILAAGGYFLWRKRARRGL